MNQLSIPKFGTNKIATVLLKYNYKAKAGDILAGIIVGKEKTQNLVDVGLAKASFLPISELTIKEEKKNTLLLNVGESGEFILLDYGLNEEKILLSLRYLHYLRLWERFSQLDVKNMILSTYGITPKRGGKLVNFDGLKLFVPNFHLPKYYKRKKEKVKYLPIKVLEVQSKRIIICSCKLAFLKKQSPSLDLGLVIDAYVLSIRPFGIFLNIYGLKALLHISELSTQRIEKNRIKSLYKKGDKIKVKVIYIDSSQGRIALSAKQVSS